MLDETLLNLTTILVSGAGLFAVLTKFSVPELRMSFLGENPFAIKREEIDLVMTWSFTLLAISGLILQAVKEIFGNEIPDRLHQAKVYVLFFAVGIVVMLSILWMLTCIGRWIARRRWLPKIVKYQRPSFETAVYIFEHDGWSEDQVKTNESYPDPDRYKRANFEHMEKLLSQIENLLELSPGHGTTKERIDKLRIIFGEGQTS